MLFDDVKSIQLNDSGGGSGEGNITYQNSQLLINTSAVLTSPLSQNLDMANHAVNNASEYGFNGQSSKLEYSSYTGGIQMNGSHYVGFTGVETDDAKFVLLAKPMTDVRNISFTANIDDPSPPVLTSNSSNQLESQKPELVNPLRFSQTMKRSRTYFKASSSPTKASSCRR